MLIPPPMSNVIPTRIRAAGATLLAGLLATFAPAGAAAQVGAPAPQGTFVFDNVTILPMTADPGAPDSEKAIPGQMVVVEGGRITGVGPAGSLSVPAGAERIDGSGRFLLPGIAEMHAHVPPGQDPPRDIVEETLFLFLANGVTTIRGMLGAPYQLELREELRRGEVAGPRFWVGAPSVNNNSAPIPEAAEALVRAHAEAGYDFLKIHPGVPRDSWDRMVQVAREVGITFAGHVPADVGIDHAVATGMQTVDHLDGFVQVTRRDDLREGASQAEMFSATDMTKLRALAGRLAEAGTWQVPTHYLWNHLIGLADAETLLALPEYRYISPGQRMGYRNQANQRRQNPNITEEMDAAHRAMRQSFLRAVHEGGVPILMGTDSPQFLNVPGFAIHHELPLMVDAGMSPYEVLLSGTRNVADYVRESLGGPGDTGVITPGAAADLILVNGNPLQDLGHLRDPAGVMVDGRWYPDTLIRERLEAIAAKYAEGG